jgi:hypothetical protein
MGDDGTLMFVQHIVTTNLPSEVFKQEFLRKLSQRVIRGWHFAAADLEVRVGRDTLPDNVAQFSA